MCRRRPVTATKRLTCLCSGGHRPVGPSNYNLAQHPTTHRDPSNISMNRETGLRICIDPTFPTTRLSMHPNPPIANAMQCDSNRGDDDPSPSSDSQPSIVSMRSSKGMAGLLLAEVGASMVELDVVAGLSGSGFKDGARIEPGVVTPMAVHGVRRSREAATVSATRNTSAPHNLGDIELDPCRDRRRQRTASQDQAQGFARSDTLLNMYASPARKASELKLLLGDSSGKVKHGAVTVVVPTSSSSSNSAGMTTVASKKSPNAITFEQGKNRARVSLDLVLENKICVEGGYVSGCVRIRVRSPSKVRGENAVSLGGGKIRIAGFEVVPGRSLRNIFYQVSAPLSDISDNCAGLFSSPPDNEGFAYVQEGKYVVPFSMLLPVVSTAGKPKGVLQNNSGVMIRYIAVASMKIVDPDTGKRSIAHFYRDCEVWPRLDPSTTLGIAPQPLRSSSAKRLFLGGDGELRLTAELQRRTWVAGQRCHVRIQVENGTKKTVRSVGLVLVRTLTVFRPSPKLEAVGFGGMERGDLGVDPDACETETVERKIAEETLHAGQKGVQGYASAKGWWTGVAAGESGTLVYSICIPSDALTVTRARLLEVEYTLKVSLGVGSITGSADAVNVSLPLRIVNFISLDPPPTAPIRSTQLGHSEMDTPRASQSASAFSGVGDSKRSSKSKAIGRPRIPSSQGSKTKAKGSRVRIDASASTESKLSSTVHSRGRPTGLPIPSNSMPLIHLAGLQGFSKSKNGDRQESTSRSSGGRVISKGHKYSATAAAMPTARTVSSDLGGIEDEDELQDVFGCEIPGSASLLEEQYITLGDCSADDSGFGAGDEWEDLSSARTSESMESFQSSVKGNKLAKRPKRAEGNFERASGVQPLPRPPRMQVINDGAGSDDEIDIMVGCASEQIGVGEWEYPPDNSFSMVQSDSQTTNASCCDDEGGFEEAAAVNSIEAGRGLLYERRGAREVEHLNVAAVPQSRQVIVKDPGSPHKHTFSERVQVKKGETGADAGSGSKTLKSAARDDLTGPKFPKAHRESPASVHSNATHAPRSAEIPQSVIKSSDRPVLMERSQTTPSSSLKQVSESKSSQLGNGLSGVRARIAMLEEQARCAKE